jgi:hypothetical protein
MSFYLLEEIKGILPCVLHAGWPNYRKRYLGDAGASRGLSIHTILGTLRNASCRFSEEWLGVPTVTTEKKGLKKIRWDRNCETEALGCKREEMKRPENHPKE